MLQPGEKFLSNRVSPASIQDNEIEAFADVLTTVVAPLIPQRDPGAPDSSSPKELQIANFPY